MKTLALQPAYTAARAPSLHFRMTRIPIFPSSKSIASLLSSEQMCTFSTRIKFYKILLSFLESFRHV